MPILPCVDAMQPSWHLGHVLAKHSSIRNHCQIQLIMIMIMSQRIHACITMSSLPSQIHTVLSRLQVANNCPVDHATDLTSFSWPSRVATHSQSFSRASYSQIPVVASKLAVAISFPEGDHAKLRIVRLCPCSSVWMHCQFDKSECDAGAHSRTVLSPEHVARMVFVGCQTACHTRSWCPMNQLTISDYVSIGSWPSG